VPMNETAPKKAKPASQRGIGIAVVGVRLAEDPFDDGGLDLIEVCGSSTALTRGSWRVRRRHDDFIVGFAVSSRLRLRSAAHDDG